MVSLLAFEPSCPGFDSHHSRNIAEVNLRRCVEISGQWLENVDQTHLILGSGASTTIKLNKHIVPPALDARVEKMSYFLTEPLQIEPGTNGLRYESFLILNFPKPCCLLEFKIVGLHS